MMAPKATPSGAACRCSGRSTLVAKPRRNRYSRRRVHRCAEDAVIKLEGIGHVNLRVADEAASKRFYRDVLGFVVAEEDPEHGGVFMTLGKNFHTLDIG
jgi:hypothetical protein